MISSLIKNKNIIIQALILVSFFVIAFILNKIPNNLFIAGGDFYQLIEPENHLYRYLFTWFNHSGQGQFNPLITTYPFYLFQATLSHFGLTPNLIFSSIVFTFLTLSFYSFYFSLKILKIKTLMWVSNICSLFYSLNLFTFSIYTYPWIATHHFLIYIFIPILLAQFYKTFTDPTKKNYIFFVIIFIFSLIAFNNFGFFLALLLIQFLLFLVYSIFRFKDSCCKKILNLVKSCLTIWLIQGILISIIFLPLFFSLVGNFDRLIHTKALGGDIQSIVQLTPNPPLNSFRLLMDNWRFPHFNLDERYEDFNNLFIFSAVFSLMPIIFICLYLFYRKKNNDNKELNLFSIFFSVFLILTFLIARLTPPFDKINLYFYTLTQGIFRSPDKLFVFYPFFLIILLVYSLQNLKFRTIIKFFTSVLILSPALFFLVGGVEYFLSKEINNHKYTIQIPIQYYEIRKNINQNNNLTGIISIPYSVINSLNWSNYPRWHFIGHDVLHLLYNKFYISANIYDHPSFETELSFKEFNENEESVDKLLELIQKFSGQFIIFHKDIEPYWIKESKHIKNKIEELEKNKKIDLVSSNDYFDLYKVKKDYLVPLIYSNTDLYFQKINPTKYKVILNLKEKTDIIFNQSYNSQWKPYLKPNTTNSWCKPIESYKVKSQKLESFNVTECEHTQKFFGGEELSYLYKKPIFDDTHHLVYKYANGWTIDPKYIKQNLPSEYYKENPDGSIDIELVLYFKSQSYFYLGLIISSITLFGCISYLGYDYAKSRRKKRKN